MKKAGTIKKCQICPNTFYCYPSVSKRFCSKTCWHLFQPSFQKGNPKFVDHLKIARELVNYKSEKRRNKLSNSIKNAYENGKMKKRYGEQNNLWKGGIATFQNKERHSIEYIKWRKTVFERDKYTCQHCNVVGGELHAHHIKEFSKFPQYRYDVNNGLTVCRACHCLIHGRFIPTNSLVNKKLLEYN